MMALNFVRSGLGEKLGRTIQQVVCDPEITIAIFSATKPLAQEILGQIKNEFETNEHLKEVFSDVLYGNPRMKGEDGRPAKWSLQRGITVKRKGKPKEATIEAHGLIDGQPTGRHSIVITTTTSLLRIICRNCS